MEKLEAANLEYNLTTHLLNVSKSSKGENPGMLKLGKREELTSTLLKVSELTPEILKSCFQDSGFPTNYPELPKNTFVIVFRDIGSGVNAIALYSLSHMRKMYDQEFSPLVKTLEWSLLEIENGYYSKLLRCVDIKNNSIN